MSEHLKAGKIPMSNPLFSLVIPNYNNGRFLRDALESVYRQTYPHWEIILVDDRSTDESFLIYQEIEKDKRIKLLKNKLNKGHAYTVHRGLKHVSGEILGLLDPDDTLHPEALEVMVQKHLAWPKSSMIYSTHIRCDEKLKPIQVAHFVGSIPEGMYSWQCRGTMPSQFATFKREVYEKTEEVSSWFLKTMDYDLYFKLEEVGPIKFVDKTLYNYRIHTTNISQNKNRSWAKQFAFAAMAMVHVRAKVDPHALRLMTIPKNVVGLSLFIVGCYLVFHKQPIEGMHKMGLAIRKFRWGLLAGSSWYFRKIGVRLMRKIRSSGCISKCRI